MRRKGTLLWQLPERHTNKEALVVTLKEWVHPKQIFVPMELPKVVPVPEEVCCRRVI